VAVKSTTTVPLPMALLNSSLLAHCWTIFAEFIAFENLRIYNFIKVIYYVIFFNKEAVEKKFMVEIISV
jgi:hypothetical protein